MRLPLYFLACVATVAGAADYPAPIQALVRQGVTVEAQFDTGTGLKGYAARAQGEALALYLTPDGKHVIAGTMLDANGQEVTGAQLRKHLPQPEFGSAWPLLEQATWVREGPQSAKRVIYVFTDPECPYCHKLWQAMQPHVGPQLQVRHILVGTLKATSLPKAAAILQHADPAKALEQHEKSFTRGGIAPASQIASSTNGKLERNHKLMKSLDLAGTPAVFYRDRSGKVRRVVGMPDAGTLEREILQAASR